MARIRLYLRASETQEVVDSLGNTIRLPFLRLSVLFYVGAQRFLLDGLIDSGAPLNVFPEKYWKQFEPDIEWLTFPPGVSPSAWWTTVTGLTGGSFPCRLGRVSVIPFDTERRQLPADLRVRFRPGRHGRGPRGVVAPTSALPSSPP